jgi:hypothetical protein
VEVVVELGVGRPVPLPAGVVLLDVAAAAAIDERAA